MKIICHGGAGHTPKVQDGVDSAAEKGWEILKETDNLEIMTIDKQ